MTKVEVDIKDLETIVFATAAIKKIETALSTRKHDPFVKPYLEYNEAHNNITAALTSAKRSQQTYATPWDGELSIAELKYLLEIRPYITYKKLTGGERLRRSEIDSLLSKGCIRMGQLVSGVVWTNEEYPFLEKMPEFGVEITPRGKDKLAKAIKDKVISAESGSLRGSDYLELIEADRPDDT